MTKVDIKNEDGITKVCIRTEGAEPTEFEVRVGQEACLSVDQGGGVTPSPVEESEEQSAEEAEAAQAQAEPGVDPA